MIKEKIIITQTVDADTEITTIKGNLQIQCAIKIQPCIQDNEQFGLFKQIEEEIKDQIVDTIYENIIKEWTTLKVLLLQDQAKTRYDETYYSNLVKIGDQIRKVDECLRG